MKEKFQDSKTIENLARAFAGECQEGARYQFIAQKAMQEGYPYIQTLLKGIAKNEMAHAKTLYETITNRCPNANLNNIDISGGYPFKAGTLIENLKHCYENEESEKNVIYPNFSQIAKDEGYTDIQELFDKLAEVENCHHLMVKEIHDKLLKDKLYKVSKALKWKCNQCGFERTSKEAWQVCPLCSAQQGYVMFPIADQQQ